MDEFEKALAVAKARDEAIIKNGARPRGCDSAKIITVIETRSIRGHGITNDPVREVVQYWSADGSLLAENDPV